MRYRILITGGHGFVGKNLVGYLGKHLDHPDVQLLAPTRFQLDLLDTDSIYDILDNFYPDCIVNLAATCGGIGANKDSPGRFMLDNLNINLNLINTLHNLRMYQIKLIQVGSICAYPKYCPPPFLEEDIWKGYPEETNAPYGIAKKTITELLIAMNKQYGMKCVNLYPVNMYGPRDNFDLHTSHVIPAIIRKIDIAKEQNDNSITLWGTGKATRDFLYVKDFCRVIKLAIEKDPGPEPINLGSGSEYSIEETANNICKIMEYDGKIFWDDSQPDGQPRRCVSIQHAYDTLGYLPSTGLREGLEKTIAWFEKYKDDINDRCNYF